MNTRSRKQPLTAVQIAEMSEGGNTELADGLYCVGPHLYVQIRSRSATWVMRWYKGPRVFTLGLGSLQAVGKGAAERMRDQYLQMVKDGADPRAIHKALKRSAKTTGTASPAAPVSLVPTFRNVARDYIMKNEARLKSTGKMERLLKAYVYRHIEAVPVDRVTSDHLLAILQPLWRDHQPTARSVRSLLRKVLAWAKAHGHRAGDNPADDEALTIRLGGSVQHEATSFRAISYRDAPRLWKALSAQADVVADVIMFQMLTGARPTEAREARWSEVDAKVWTIPADRTKKGKAHRVPLSTQAIAVLERRRAEGDLIFPSERRRNQPVDPSSPRHRIAALGFDGTAHGMRSALTDFATDVLKLDVDLQEKMLAHAERDRTRGAYARSDRFDARVEPMQSWANFLTGVRPRKG